MKHKEKQKHLESRHLNRTEEKSSGASNPQETAPQPQATVEATACSQAAGAKLSSSSEYFTCVSSQAKRPCPDQDGPCNTQENARQHESPVEAPASVQEAGGDPSPSEYFTCVSSPSKLPHSDVNGPYNTQEDVPQRQSPVESSACSQAAGVNSFTSEYSSFLCSSCKQSSPDEDGILEIYVSQNLKQKENSLDTSHTHIPSHSVNNNEPCTSSMQGTDLRLRTIYYTRVQLKRGVAVLCHTQERLEPPSKKIKMEEMTYIEKIHENVRITHMSENKPLIDHQHNLESRAQEEREEADSPAQPPALDGDPSAKTPEWLVALDSGFRCMACCRVFPSLEVLQEHVECGVREGFSCHAFHNAMARLKHKDLKEDEQEN
ncbi:Protein FAM170A [Myotis davidii]|uniref:Protein FAM170A n=1 Tax=Myotis davidii TaxID=225400 RepID=L5ME19_MYODS|nr:Protein FAM170A [Myotis davidii]